jgi:small-conductance mechanosensitive channel
VRVGVAYGSPVKLVSELMIQAMKEQPEVIEGSDQTVLFDSFGDNALEFDGFLWSI